MIFKFLAKKKSDNIKTAQDIPKTTGDVRLENSVDRLWTAHQHFTEVLKEFTEDIQKKNNKGTAND